MAKMNEQKLKSDIVEMSKDETFMDSVAQCDGSDTASHIENLAKNEILLSDLSPLTLMRIGSHLSRWQTYKASGFRKLRLPADSVCAEIDSKTVADTSNALAVDRIHAMFPEGFTGYQVLAAVASGLQMYNGFISDNSEIASEDLQSVVKDVSAIAIDAYKLADRMQFLEDRAFPPSREARIKQLDADFETVQNHLNDLNACNVLDRIRNEVHSLLGNSSL